METFYYGDDDKQDQAVNFELKKDHLQRSLRGVVKILIIMQVCILILWSLIYSIYIQNLCNTLLTWFCALIHSILVEALWNWSTSSTKDGCENPLIDIKFFSLWKELEYLRKMSVSYSLISHLARVVRHMSKHSLFLILMFFHVADSYKEKK